MKLPSWAWIAGAGVAGAVLGVSLGRALTGPQAPSSQPPSLLVSGSWYVVGARVRPTAAETARRLRTTTHELLVAEVQLAGLSRIVSLVVGGDGSLIALGQRMGPDVTLTDAPDLEGLSARLALPDEILAFSAEPAPPSSFRSSGVPRGMSPHQVPLRFRKRRADG